MATYEVIDLGQYEGIAASMAKYLDTWLLSDGEPPTPHPGRAYAALELLISLHEGAEVECMVRSRFTPAREAGVGGGVLRSLPGRYSTPEDAEKVLDAYVKCFTRFVDGTVKKSAVDVEEVRELKRFFEALQYRARQAAQADIAQSERSARSLRYR